MTEYVLNHQQLRTKRATFNRRQFSATDGHRQFAAVPYWSWESCGD